jgi:hypothetical protein
MCIIANVYGSLEQVGKIENLEKELQEKSASDESEIKALRKDLLASQEKIKNLELQLADSGKSHIENEAAWKKEEENLRNKIQQLQSRNGDLLERTESAESERETLSKSQEESAGKVKVMQQTIDYTENKLQTLRNIEACRKLENFRLQQALDAVKEDMRQKLQQIQDLEQVRPAPTPQHSRFSSVGEAILLSDLMGNASLMTSAGDPTLDGSIPASSPSQPNETAESMEVDVPLQETPTVPSTGDPTLDGGIPASSLSQPNESAESMEVDAPLQGTPTVPSTGDPTWDAAMPLPQNYRTTEPMHLSDYECKARPNNDHEEKDSASVGCTLNDCMDAQSSPEITLAVSDTRKSPTIERANLLDEVLADGSPHVSPNNLDDKHTNSIEPSSGLHQGRSVFVGPQSRSDKN